ncbi:hypothetical protein FUA23_21160 [Neolewinella aurantiaca]|uniref:Uncharacterized protein n=1 Tax=Neolewinella aurantiaca TaxID=2602767 RepID=A0A5C7FHB7_9BACT|nr:hypothetical protein [Neolewinella aurantiaca]TXF84370.1 hypothetical protein FUA23_21160 [Neolewinella aurantiaca]
MSKYPIPADSTIEEVMLKLKSASGPVTKNLYSSNGFQVIVLGLNAGELFPDHVTKVPAKLTVLEGSVVYQDADTSVPLFCYDEIDIPVDKVHSVLANRRSICLLIRG